MQVEALSEHYRDYIDCLNRQSWTELGGFVADGVTHNGRKLGLEGYRAMLVADYRTIPDLRFSINLLVCEPPRIAARLLFDCCPHGHFLGLPIDGRRVSFSENVFYEFKDRRIVAVWSVLDKSAIEAQLGL